MNRWWQYQYSDSSYDLWTIPTRSLDQCIHWFLRHSCHSGRWSGIVIYIPDDSTETDSTTTVIHWTTTTKQSQGHLWKSSLLLWPQDLKKISAIPNSFKYDNNAPFTVLVFICFLYSSKSIQIPSRCTIYRPGYRFTKALTQIVKLRNYFLL